MPQRTGQGHNNRRVGRRAILQGNSVHGARDVGIATVRREDRPAEHKIANRAGERRDPAERAFPGDRNIGQLVAYAIDLERGPRQRRPGAREEVSGAGVLDGRARGAMQCPDRVNRRVGGMNAGQRQPVVAGDLPGYGRQWKQRHECSCIFVGDWVE
jgi:hypothetical protein